MFDEKDTPVSPPTNNTRNPNPEPFQVEAVYLALAAEAAGGGGGADGKSSSPSPRNISGKKRARVGDAGAVVAASGEKHAGSDGGETSDGDRNGSIAGSSSNNRSSSSSGSSRRPTPAKARSLLHATISRYFDDGSHNRGDESCGGGCAPSSDCYSTGGASGSGDHASGSGYATGGADLTSMAVEGRETATTSGSTAAATAAEATEGEDEEEKAKKRAEALPHQPLDKRACEVLVRDASVLVTDPSFQGRLDAGFDDSFGGGSGGGGLGFFDVATGTTAAAGGGGGAGARGMAPHSWLLKVNEDVVCGVATALAFGGGVDCMSEICIAHLRGVCLCVCVRRIGGPRDWVSWLMGVCSISDVEIVSRLAARKRTWPLA